MALNVKGPSRTAPQEELTDAPDAVEKVDQAETPEETKASTPKVEKTQEVKAEKEATNADEQVDASADAEVETEDAADASAEQPEVDSDGEQAEAKQTTTSTSTAVQPAQASRVAVTSQNKGAAASYFSQLIKELEDSGQEGLEMGFGVFPMISLDKGEFKVGDEDIGRDSFEGVPMTSKPKFAYRTTGIPDKDTEVVFADSDKAHQDVNSEVSARLLEWKEKHPDSGWEVKKYHDVYMYITNMPGKPDMVGQIALLSVAPTSVKLYTRACITVKGKGREAHECVFRVSVGEKIRGEFDYYPWDFKAIGSCQKLGVEIKFGGEIDEDF